MSTARRFDLLCIGRAAVDLYGEQIGAPLEEQTSFAKYLGGCPANIAVGAARLGLAVAMLTRVGDEHNGRFVRNALAAAGVDVGGVRTDSARLTALVFLAIKDRQTFPLLFYRHDCADMAICAADIDPAAVASAQALLFSGTHLSQPLPAAACFAAGGLARAAATRVVFDIDYRPVLWGLTGLGRGEDRFVAAEAVTRQLQQALPLCDLVIGTEEEFHIAGGAEDTIAALRAVRAVTAATLVVKRGPIGCAVFDAAIPATLDQGIRGPAFTVEVFNVLGAGDGFAAGFLSGWLRGATLAQCCRLANACGALVVSRHGCAPAMPSRQELDVFLSRSDWPRRLREDAALAHLHRATTRARQWPEVLALAFDHRRQLEDLAQSAGIEHAAAPAKIRRFKQLVAAALTDARERGCGAVGALIDARYGEDALHALTGSGIWIARPVEVAGAQMLAFEGGDAVLAQLRDWPADHVVKCLVQHHPDDPPARRAAQLGRLRNLALACVHAGRELLLEVIAKSDTADSDDATVARALQQIYECGIRPEWWKLVPPASQAQWQAIEGVIERHDPWCRGVLLLGLEASEEALQRGFALAAAHPLCKGFAVGRSIFMDAARRWFAGHSSDAVVIDTIARNYLSLVALWRRARPAPHHTSDGDKQPCNGSVSSASV